MIDVKLKVDKDDWKQFKQNVESIGVSPYTELRRMIKYYNKNEGGIEKSINSLLKLKHRGG